jgi:chemotaxis protein CheD
MKANALTGTSDLTAPNFSVASSSPMPQVHLYPGQVFISGEGVMVSTILGSCVAVCLWDAQANLGGINHFLLPSDPLRNRTDLRYGNNAVAQLIDDMVSRGASPSRMVAKVAGGACVLEGFAAKRSIGEQNLAVALQVLKQYEITVSSEHTGGKRGRKLLFCTGNGAAFSKEI